MSAPDDWEPDQPVSEADWAGGLIELRPLQKDEWHHRLYEKFQEQGRSIAVATKLDPLGFRYDERWFSDDQSSSSVRLRLLNGRPGFYVLVVTRGDPDQRAFDHFREAVDAATAGLGSTMACRWEATVCQLGQRGRSNMSSRLGSRFRAGKLDIADWGQLQSEPMSTWFPGTGVCDSVWYSWPIRIRDTVRCYAWDKDGVAEAARRLRRLAESLTLAFDVPIEVRAGPYEVRTNSEETASRTVPFLRSEEVPDPGSESRTIEVPDWVGNKKPLPPGADRALAVYHEAMHLQADRPSIALIGYIAAIEAMVIARKGLPKCSGECRGPYGMADAFRRGVSEVLDHDETQLLANAYDRRSKTAHEARLFGSEHVLGMWPGLGYYTPDPVASFERNTVQTAAKACRQLLLRAVAGATSS